MSGIVIQGNTSGTGTFTITAPNSDTSRTLTLPDVSGTLVTGDDIAINGITSDYTAGTALNIDSSGRVTTPQQVSFRAEKTVDQTGTFPGTITVTWDSMAYDVGSNFNLAADRFYAPVTGKYVFSAGLRVDLIDSAANYYIIKIVTSNANYVWILAPKFSTDLAYMTFTLSTIADLDASDYCFIQIQQSSGHATTHVHGSVGYDWFCGHLLG